ncbi:hypothetical protein [Aurantiacibacter gilvus]|uniref:Lipoprotein n=1 Tax=Aurantiacibacter gilvus TaxID=3139141 RepID=A0ABU9ICD3_9SPHN
MKKIALFAGVALLASCGSPNEGTIETEDGEVTYDIDEGGDGIDATFTGPDGEVARFESGPNTQAELPSGFTIYPGATVVMNQTVTTNDGGGSILVMTASASAEEVIEFYRGQASRAGIDIASEMNANGTRVIGGEAEDGTALSVSAIPSGDGTTQIQLTIGRGN